MVLVCRFIWPQNFFLGGLNYQIDHCVQQLICKSRWWWPEAQILTHLKGSKELFQLWQPVIAIPKWGRNRRGKILSRNILFCLILSRARSNHCVGMRTDCQISHSIENPFQGSRDFLWIEFVTRFKSCEISWNVQLQKSSARMPSIAQCEKISKLLIDSFGLTCTYSIVRTGGTNNRWDWKGKNDTWTH